MKKESKQFLLIALGVVIIIAILYYLHKKNLAKAQNQQTTAPGQNYGGGNTAPTGFPYTFYGPTIINDLSGQPSNNYNIGVNGPLPWNFLSQNYIPLFGFIGVYGGNKQ